MPVYQLSNQSLAFPPVSHANPDGLLAVGGLLRADWLLKAYSVGLFPWFNPGEDILWWSPDPRYVILPHEVRIQKSMHSYLNNPKLEFRLDTAFEQVIDLCAKVPRKGLTGTWISKEMKQAYTNLHDLGMAHSAEIYREGRLIGGLYGVSIGSVFFGESMFSIEKNMSKLALIRLCQWLEDREFLMVDCQVFSKHIVSMGAVPVDRSQFIEALEVGLEANTLRGKWSVDMDRNTEV